MPRPLKSTSQEVTSRPVALHAPLLIPPHWHWHSYSATCPATTTTRSIISIEHSKYELPRDSKIKNVCYASYIHNCCFVCEFHTDTVGTREGLRHQEMHNADNDPQKIALWNESFLLKFNHAMTKEQHLAAKRTVLSTFIKRTPGTDKQRKWVHQEWLP